MFLSLEIVEESKYEFALFQLPMALQSVDKHITNFIKKIEYHTGAFNDYL